MKLKDFGSALLTARLLVSLGEALTFWTAPHMVASSVVVLVLVLVLAAPPGVSAARATNLMLGLLVHDGAYDREQWGYDTALAEVNANSTVLPGLTLSYTQVDGGCNGDVGVSGALQLSDTLAGMQAANSHTPVGYVGTRCSSTMQAVAPVIRYIDYTIISASVTSPIFEQEKYADIFRIASSDTVIGIAMALFCQRYEWKRVHTITGSEIISLSTMSKFTEYATSKGLTVDSATVIPVDLDELIIQKNLNRMVFDILNAGKRVIVMHMYEKLLRRVMCALHQNGLTGKGSVIMYPGWIGVDWFQSSKYNCADFNGGRNTNAATCERCPCSDAQLFAAMKGMFTVDADTIPSLDGLTIGGSNKGALVQSAKDFWAANNMAPRTMAYAAYDSIWSW